MSGVYWLASYPKSGNTWLRALLTNYRRDDDRPASINDLDGDWTASLRDIFDECTGIESADLTPQQIAHYRPLVHECLAARSATPCFFKVHDAFTVGAGARPLFPPNATAGVIYMLRNPLDVAVSYAHHRNEPIEDTIGFMGRDDAMLAGPDAAGEQFPQRLLSWSGHVRSWVDEPGLNIHVVRYEDLAQHPADTFAGVVRFAGLPLESGRLRKAVAFSDFRQLQRQEAVGGFAEKQPTALSFFREGRVGSWKTHLTGAHVRRLAADHHDVMHRFGYLEDARELISTRPGHDHLQA